MASDEKIEEILKIVKEERVLNNSRLAQLSTALQDFRQNVNGRMDKLEGEIKKVYTTLTEDTQVFAEDLAKVKRRVDKIERKIA